MLDFDSCDNVVDQFPDLVSIVFEFVHSVFVILGLLATTNLFRIENRCFSFGLCSSASSDILFEPLTLNIFLFVKWSGFFVQR